MTITADTLVDSRVEVSTDEEGEHGHFSIKAIQVVQRMPGSRQSDWMAKTEDLKIPAWTSK